jgi:pimeloyl-ACP methyl ester carboxylesterase
MKRGWWLALVLALLAACEPAAPTPLPTRTVLPEIAPSPTVNPVLPSVDPFDQPGQNIPDAAVAPNDMAVEGVVPLPGEAAVEVIASRDGLRMQATLYPADAQPAPAVLLLHMLNGRKEDWLPLVTPLQQAGYTVLAVDLRGHGVTGSVANWTTARQDVLDMIEYLRLRPEVDAGRIAVIGASIGANLAISGCAMNTFCSAVVALSPGLDYQGVVAEGAVAQLGDRPLLLAAAQGDGYAAQSVQALDGLASGPHELMLLTGSAHGTNLFDAQPDFARTILVWLQGHL